MIASRSKMRVIFDAMRERVERNKEEENKYQRGER